MWLRPTSVCFVRTRLNGGSRNAVGVASVARRRDAVRVLIQLDVRYFVATDAYSLTIGGRVRTAMTVTVGQLRAASHGP
jgi:hypothetical protein